MNKRIAQQQQRQPDFLPGNKQYRDRRCWWLILRNDGNVTAQLCSANRIWNSDEETKIKLEALTNNYTSRKGARILQLYIKMAFWQQQFIFLLFFSAALSSPFAAMAAEDHIINSCQALLDVRTDPGRVVKQVSVASSSVSSLDLTATTTRWEINFTFSSVTMNTSKAKQTNGQIQRHICWRQSLPIRVNTTAHSTKPLLPQLMVMVVAE